MSVFSPSEVPIRISSTLYDWLEAEVKTSSQPNDVNAVLNEYDQAIEGLKGGFDHPTNFAWNKVNSHADRLETWVEAYSETRPEDKDFDAIAVKIIFGGLMQISGAYRDQCYISSQDANEYLENRKKVTGLKNLNELVEGRLGERLPDTYDFTAAKIDLDELEQSRERVSSLGVRAVKVVCSRATYGYDLGQPFSRSVDELRLAQAHWLDFTVDSIVMTAKQKQGDLEAVPFWEPRSITEQSGRLYFPLREHIDWAEVISS